MKLHIILDYLLIKVINMTCQNRVITLDIFLVFVKTVKDI